MRARDVAIVVDDIVCRYDAIPALAGVTLTVSPGEFCGVIGPNGSGKTTLLRAIYGAIAPERGIVLLERRPVETMTPREIAAMAGVVPQRAGSAFGFSVLEMISMGRTPHLAPLAAETPQDVAVVQRAMVQTGTGHLASRGVDSLSGGEFQRVLIARALAQEPRILLLDEPTAHLDLRYQMEIMDLLTSLNPGGIALVAALHDVNLASSYCDRLIVLSAGRVMALGPPADVLTASTLEAVYGVPMTVMPHPTTGRPHVIAAGQGVRSTAGRR